MDLFYLHQKHSDSVVLNPDPQIINYKLLNCIRELLCYVYFWIKPALGA